MEIEMKSKKLIITLSSVFVLLVALLFAVVLPIVNSGDDTTTPAPVPLEGEGVLYGSLMTYPQVKEESIESISILNDNGGYSFAKDEELSDFFVIYNEEGYPYLPPVYLKDSEVPYSSFYATDSFGDYGSVYRLTYLTSAIGTLYFSNRIEITDDLDLSQYGLARNEEGGFDRAFMIEYKDDDGNLKSHTVIIGDATPNNSGYYTLVDGRNYVYVTSNKNLSYALESVNYFIKPASTAPGLAIDKGQEPYLVSDFAEWKVFFNEEEGTVIEDGVNVIVTAGVAQSSGEYEEDEKKEIDLSDKGVYDEIKNALLGKTVGSGDGIFFTFDTMNEDGKHGVSVGDSCVYSILSIDAVVLTDSEITEAGYPVGSNTRLKVSYRRTVNGEPDDEVYSGYIDLSWEFLDESLVALLSDKTVGKFASPLEYSIVYTEDNTKVLKGSLIINSIEAIYNTSGFDIPKVVEECIVLVNCSYVIDGVNDGQEHRYSYDFSRKDDSGNMVYADVYEKLKGMTVSSGLSIEVENTSIYSSVFSSFTTYRISSIDAVVTKKKVVSFHFSNASERDPFYSESLYTNTTDNENWVYGLNDSSCTEIVRLFGGIDISSSSGDAHGLIGLETVAIGLDAEVKVKYGLYANIIYFELPRYISDKYVDGELTDDYTWMYTLGFTLYISDETEDGYRYVGSDMYDNVIKISGDALDFLDKSFAEYWARKTLVIIDSNDLTGLTFDVNMKNEDGVSLGTYDFDIAHRQDPIEGSEATYDHMIPTVTVSSELDTALSLWMEKKGVTEASFEEFFAEATGEIQYGTDTIGTAYLKKLILMLYSTKYEGILTEEEKANAVEGEELLTMSVSLKAGGAERTYVYKFYRVSDRHVMVSLYGRTSSGAYSTVSDFYVLSSDLKRVVSALMCLVNGEKFDSDSTYIN